MLEPGMLRPATDAVLQTAPAEAGRADHGKALRTQALDGRNAAWIVRQMVERHRRAASGEQFDRRQPDAGGCAGNQRRLAREISHAALERSGDYVCRALR